ncbi:MAG: Crp/Fnr family transcriptional regulator [Sphingomonadales bacterium]|nr:Crp/Fnr family transcriptional regulator [Sphingomonadales bacterium]
MLEESNLLAALRPKDRALLEPLMTECDLSAGETIYEPGEVVRHAYFPRGAALAVFLVLMENGDVVETTMVGREGAIGGIVSQGSVPCYARSCVMHEGGFYRIATADLERVKEQSPQIRHLFARYADCMMAQVFQAVACNASHTIEQRAAKWLCAALERTGKDEISMTQEQLAAMMGIGRSYASRVVQRFKADKIIQTRRGGLKVLDSQKLYERACSCNELVKRHFNTVLKGVYPE